MGGLRLLGGSGDGGWEGTYRDGMQVYISLHPVSLVSGRNVSWAVSGGRPVTRCVYQ